MLLMTLMMTTAGGVIEGDPPHWVLPPHPPHSTPRHDNANLHKIVHDKSFVQKDNVTISGKKGE